MDTNMGRDLDDCIALIILVYIVSVYNILAAIISIASSNEGMSS